MYPKITTLTLRLPDIAMCIARFKYDAVTHIHSYSSTFQRVTFRNVCNIFFWFTFFLML